MTTAGAWVAIIVAVIGGLSGIAALVRTFLERPKLRADAMSLVNQAAINTLREAREVTSETQGELKLVKIELRTAEDRIDELEDREDMYVDALRLMFRHVQTQQRIISAAGLAAPESPIDSERLEQLLTRFKTRS